jgi:hypothetical protein
MTVAELIEELKKFDAKQEVEAECGSCGYCTTLDEIEPKGKRYPRTVVIK